MFEGFKKWSWQFEAIGTLWKIDTLPAPAISEQEVLNAVKIRIEEFDENYSRFREDSLVSEMSKKPGEYVLPEDADELFSLYFKLYKLTNGFFTPLIGNTLEEAGYDAKYSLQEREIRPVKKLEDTIVYSDKKLLVKEPVVLDFGAAGKGYLIDLVGGILEGYGMKNFCIDAGQDILYKSNGTEQLLVGLENPSNHEQVIGTTNIFNESICASSGSRRKWGRFHHIINPKTLSSPEEILATWVITRSALLADGLSTSLFFVEPKVLESQFNFEWFILHKDYSISKSKNFPGEIFKK